MTETIRLIPLSKQYLQIWLNHTFANHLVSMGGGVANPDET